MYVVTSYYDIVFFIVTTISFEEPTYSIKESEGVVPPVLKLSNPLSKSITVKVFSIDGSAGECLH